MVSVSSRVSGSLTEKEIRMEAGEGAQERGCVWAGRAPPRFRAETADIVWRR